MKTIIKRLADAVGNVLSANEEANYYNGLFDGGEWSSSVPDFTGLIETWKLDRETLCSYIDIAELHITKFKAWYPPADFKVQPEKGIFYIIDLCKWYHISQALHSIFMAGNLQPSNNN